MKSKQLFPHKIKMLRARDKMSQETLAEKLGLYPKSITKFESEKPTLNFDTLDKLADIFQVLPSFFFSPVDTSLNVENNEMKQLIIKKLEELDSKEMKLLYKFIFSIKD